MVGVFWATNIALSVVELLAGLLLVAIYTRSALRVRSRPAALLAMLGGVVLAHAAFSITASLNMISKGLGSEAAIPLIPVNGLGALIAVIIALIASR